MNKVNELKKEIERLENLLFSLDMIDTWNHEIANAYNKAVADLKKINEELAEAIANC